MDWEGEGSFVNVEKGLDPKARKYYAIKFISLLGNKSGKINEKLKEKTMREIDILSKFSTLNSKFIIKFYKDINDLKNNKKIIVLENWICTLHEIFYEVEKSNEELYFEISHFFEILLKLV